MTTPLLPNQNPGIAQRAGEAPQARRTSAPAEIKPALARVSETRIDRDEALPASSVEVSRRKPKVKRTPRTNDTERMSDTLDIVSRPLGSL